MLLGTFLSRSDVPGCTSYSVVCTALTSCTGSPIKLRRPLRSRPGAIPFPSSSHFTTISARFSIQPALSLVARRISSSSPACLLSHIYSPCTSRLSTRQFVITTPPHQLPHCRLVQRTAAPRSPTEPQLSKFAGSPPEDLPNRRIALLFGRHSIMAQ